MWCGSRFSDSVLLCVVEQKLRRFEDVEKKGSGIAERERRSSGSHSYILDTEHIHSDTQIITS